VLTDELLHEAAGIQKVFHRRRILKWVGMLECPAEAALCNIKSAEELAEPLKLSLSSPNEHFDGLCSTNSGSTSATPPSIVAAGLVSLASAPAAVQPAAPAPTAAATSPRPLDLLPVLRAMAETAGGTILTRAGLQAVRTALRAALCTAGVVTGTEFHPGQRVTLCELHGSPELNGKTGTISWESGFNAAKQRFSVAIDDSSARSMFIRPACLRALDEPPRFPEGMFREGMMSSPQAMANAAMAKEIEQLRGVATRAREEGLKDDLIEALRKQAKVSRESFGAVSHVTTSSLFNLGNELRFESRHAEAAAIYRQLVPLYRAPGGFAGLEPGDLWMTLTNLSVSVAAAGGHSLAAADAVLDSLCARFEVDPVGPDLLGSGTTQMWGRCAQLFGEAGEHDIAVKILQDTIAGVEHDEALVAPPIPPKLEEIMRAMPSNLMARLMPPNLRLELPKQQLTAMLARQHEATGLVHLPTNRRGWSSAARCEAVESQASELTEQFQRLLEEPVLTAFDAGVGGEIASWDSFDHTMQREFTIDPAITDQSRSMRLKTCLGQFAQFATPIAQQIIDELHLPDDEKRFKRVDVGGVAGGTKYKVNGIFFKVISDRDLYMYDGSQAMAGKAAGHELKSLSALMSTGVALINYPLQQLVDYRGFRVSMTQELPLSGDGTLLYGSVDGGKTVCADPSVAPAMEEVAAALNLKKHMSAVGVEVCMPVDLEVHRAVNAERRDGRTYVVDTHRLMPAVAPPLVARSMCVVGPCGTVRSYADDIADDCRNLADMLRFSQKALQVPHVCWCTKVLDTGASICIVFESTEAEQQAAVAATTAAATESASTDTAAASYAALAALDDTYTVAAHSYNGAEQALACHGYSTDSVEQTATPSQAEPAPDPRTGAVNDFASKVLGRQITGLVAVCFNCNSKWRHMYQMLRCEAVRASPTPLSSDAFGPRQFGTTRKDEAEVLQASQAMLDGLPAIAAELDALALAASKQAAFDWALPVKKFMHERRTNLRYLGKIRSFARTAAARELLLAHAVARTARRLVQAELRQAVDASGQDVVYVDVAHMLNRLADFEELFTLPFMVEVHACFSGIFSAEEWTASTPLALDDESRSCALTLFSRLVGVPAETARGRVLQASDIQALCPVVKMITVPVTPHVDMTDPVALAAVEKQLCDEVARREQTLGLNHKQVLVTLDHLCMLRGSKGNFAELAEAARKRADIVRAAEMPELMHALSQLSDALNHASKTQEAMDVITEMETLSPGNAVHTRARMLVQHGNLEEAKAVVEAEYARMLQDRTFVKPQDRSKCQLAFGDILLRLAEWQATNTGDLGLLSAQANPDVKRGLEMLRVAEVELQTRCGEKSKDRIYAMSMLAAGFLHLNRWADSVAQYKKTLAIADEVFGNGHKTVIQIKGFLSTAIGHQMRQAPEVERKAMVDDALALKREAVRRMEEQDPNNLTCIQESLQLASLLKRADRLVICVCFQWHCVVVL
jgi:hypothetical protein